MTWPKSLRKALIPILTMGAAGCFQSPAFYDDGRDTVQHFGNGRFQVVEGNPKSYALEDATKGIIVDRIVSWNEKGQLAYVISANPQQFYLIDTLAEKINEYDDLKQIPTQSRKIFRSMFTNELRK